MSEGGRERGREGGRERERDLTGETDDLSEAALQGGSTWAAISQHVQLREGRREEERGGEMRQEGVTRQGREEGGGRREEAYNERLREGGREGGREGQTVT